MLNGFDVYCIYVALKSHFKSSYDYFQYNGKTSVKYDSYLSRNDKIFFEKLAKKYKTKEAVVSFFASNFISNDDLWIGEFSNSENERIYTEWKKRTESLEYTFTNDVDKLVSYLEAGQLEFNELFVCKNKHPLIFKMVLTNTISPETYSILNSILNFHDKFNKELEFDPVWSTLSHKYSKYEKFLTFDKKKYKDIIKNKVKVLCSI